MLSITSLDQGKLLPKPKNEDDYYARYMTAADKAEPAVQKIARSKGFPAFAWARLLSMAST